jgi:hypothetical protein
VCELQKVTAYPIESSRKGGAKPKKIDVSRDRALGGEKRGSTIAIPATDQLINWCNECNSLFWDRCEVDNHTIIEDIATKIT